MRGSSEPPHVPEGHGNTSAVPVLEVLDAAQTLEPAVDHDPQSGAQGFTLLHATEHQETTADVTVHEDNLSKPGLPG